MTLLNDLPLQQLRFYVTTPYPCGYLPGRSARSLIATPQRLIDTAVYGELVRMGFRRSGLYTYRPHCENCQACVPVRLRVDDLTPSRSQRRAWKRHQNLQARVLPLDFSDDHFQLYAGYQKARHAGSGMDKDDADQYRSFLTQSQIDTALVEFREDGVLRLVSVVDRLGDGLSAVYAFYDTTTEGASFGTYNVLWLADWCRQLGLPYLYLGYWIKESRKMAYKTDFRPLERLTDGNWLPLETL
jgi:arginyl-tRNA--protein-N-Asp/Glu arginylyltransferase